MQISLRSSSSSTARSFSPTCSSPFFKICIMTSFTSLVPKAFCRSSADATAPFETLVKTDSIWITSERSVWAPVRHARTVLE